MKKSTISLPISLIIMALSFSSLTGCTTTNPNPKAKPESAARYNTMMGAEYLRKGRMKLANEKLQKALEQDPESADAHHYYALLQQTLKKDSSAMSHFKKATRYAPDSPEINNNFGSFLCKQQKFKEAESYFLKAADDPLYSTPAFALTNAGVCAHDAGSYDKADTFLRKALKKQPNFPPALYATAKLAYDQRDYSRAQAFLFRYNENAGENAKSLVLCKEIHTQLGEIKKADECATKLLQKFPESKEATGLN